MNHYNANLPVSEEREIINLPSIEEGVLLHNLMHESLKAYIAYSQVSARPKTDEMPIFNFAMYHGNDIFTVYQQNGKFYAFIMLSDSCVHTNYECATYREAFDAVQHQLMIDMFD